MILLQKFESIHTGPLATDVFAYEQWRNSELLLVHVELRYHRNALISDLQARHWLYVAWLQLFN